jgi:hypothetical protein
VFHLHIHILAGDIKLWQNFIKKLHQTDTELQ